MANATQLFKVKLDNENTRKYKPRKVIKRPAKGDPYYPTIMQVTSNPIEALKIKNQMNQNLVMNEIAKKIQEDAFEYNKAKMSGASPKKLFFLNNLQEAKDRKMEELLKRESELGQDLTSTKIKLNELTEQLANMSQIDDSGTLKSFITTQSGNLAFGKRPPLNPLNSINEAGAAGATGNMDDMDDDEFDDEAGDEINIDDADVPEHEISPLRKFGYWINVEKDIPNDHYIIRATRPTGNENYNMERKIIILNTSLDKRNINDVTHDEVIARCNLFINDENIFARKENKGKNKTGFPKRKNFANAVILNEEALKNRKELDKEELDKGLDKSINFLDESEIGDSTYGENESARKKFFESDPEFSQLLKYREDVQKDIDNYNEKDDRSNGDGFTKLLDIMSNIEQQLIHASARLDKEWAKEQGTYEDDEDELDEEEEVPNQEEVPDREEIIEKEFMSIQKVRELYEKIEKAKLKYDKLQGKSKSKEKRKILLKDIDDMDKEMLSLYENFRKKWIATNIDEPTKLEMEQKIKNYIEENPTVQRLNTEIYMKERKLDEIGQMANTEGNKLLQNNILKERSDLISKKNTLKEKLAKEWMIDNGMYVEPEPEQKPDEFNSPEQEIEDTTLRGQRKEGQKKNQIVPNVDGDDWVDHVKNLDEDFEDELRDLKKEQERIKQQQGKGLMQSGSGIFLCT
jgi:hypothetical protein